MDLELRLEKLNSDFFNSYKSFLSEKKLKDLMDTRESKIRAIPYPYESFEFEKEFSKICNEFISIRLIMSSESIYMPPRINHVPSVFSEFDKSYKESKKISLMTSELLTKKDVNSEFNMTQRQSQSLIEAFKNPSPPQTYSKHKNIETKSAKSPNNSGSVNPILKFFVLIIMIVAGLGSIILFLLRLGGKSS